MATTFEILAKLRGDATAMVSEFKAGFNKVKKDADKKADGIGKRFAKSAGKVARRGVQFAGAGVAVGLGLGIKEALDFNAVLDDIQIQSEESASAMEAFQGALEATSATTALSRVELAEAGKALVDLLGPAGMNAELLDVLGRAAVASGSDVKDLAGLVSAVSDSMGIAADDTEGMENALSAFLSAGKQGKIPLEQMQSVLQNVASTFSQTGVEGTEAAAELAAALQTARRAFGSPEKAATGLEAAIGSLVTKSAELKKAGVDVFVGEGSEKRLARFSDILDQFAAAQAKGKLGVDELQDVLGRKEAVKFFNAFKDPVARKFFDDIAFSAQGATDISDDFGKRTATVGFRIKKSMNDAKLAIADALTPERIELFVAGLTTAIDVTAKLASGVSGIIDDLGEAGEEAGDFAGEAVGKGVDAAFGFMDRLRANKDAELLEILGREGRGEVILGPELPPIPGQARGPEARAGTLITPDIEAGIIAARESGGELTQRESAAQELVERGVLRSREQNERSQAAASAIVSLTDPIMTLAFEMKQQRLSVDANTRAQLRNEGRDRPPGDRGSR